MLRIPSESVEFAQDVQEKPNTTQNLNYAYASQASATLMENVSQDVESIKFYLTVFAAAKLDIIQSEVSVDNVDGTRFMTKALVFAEFLAIKRESTILP